MVSAIPLYPHPPTRGAPVTNVEIPSMVSVIRECPRRRLPVRTVVSAVVRPPRKSSTSGVRDPASWWTRQSPAIVRLGSFFGTALL